MDTGKIAWIISLSFSGFLTPIIIAIWRRKRRNAEAKREKRIQKRTAELKLAHALRQLEKRNEIFLNTMDVMSNIRSILPSIDEPTFEEIVKYTTHTGGKMDFFHTGAEMYYILSPYGGNDCSKLLRTLWYFLRHPLSFLKYRKSYLNISWKLITSILRRLLIKCQNQLK